MTSFKIFAAMFVATLAMARASAADAPNWTVDLAKSKLGFSGTQTGEPFTGSFTRYDARIAFDPAHLEASHLTVTVDLASATTGDTQRDTALPGDDWFDIAHFPQASFVSDTVRKKPDGTYQATGRLTLRGITHPLTLPFTLDIKGGSAHAKGHAALIRTAFGIGQGQWATGDYVALEVGVDIDLVATRSK
ncbi:YceI family protein [uncultured Methylovirgula sp.]|uniref:YceI family protein n=1 Tax=uncultured Methylovirgula sp. TaxID=1285960 RepID=UPI002621EA85|nr:YceI family protein [uncultured Methylovirgula sp.]